MLKLIVTVDYEIFGNGTGSIAEHVVAPTQRLADLFDRHGHKFVVFAELAELEMIERCGSDPDIGRARQQIRALYDRDYEIGLHLHSWWYNARHEGGRWALDYTEYNLCELPAPRVASAVDRSLDYLRGIVGSPDFTPVAFRAGHLLLQPTQPLAGILASRGIRVDSSVYKGGVWREYRQDYRPASRNGWYWRFGKSVNDADRNGPLLEIPIHTTMVPIWKAFSARRVRQKLQPRPGHRTAEKGVTRRPIDYLRPTYPVKLDYCSMGSREILGVLGDLQRTDSQDSGSVKPIVLIGHSKELVDLTAIANVLAFARDTGIAVTTFRDVCGDLDARAPT